VGEGGIVNIDFHFHFHIINIAFNKMQVLQPKRRPARWTEALEDEDLAFVKRFVLASGSLKDLAAVYGISYPTVRLRLDRLIAKIEILDRQDVTSPFERVLRMQHADGKIDRETLKLLLEIHQSEIARERTEWERSSR